MHQQFSEAAPGGTVSGRKAVRRQSRGLVYEYDLRSTATVQVAVHLADRVPADVVEDFGFHREHEPAAWTRSDDELEMTVELAPGDERTVVLGIATDGSDLPDDLAESGVDVEVDVGDDATVAAEGAAQDGHDDGSAAGGGARVDADGGLVDAAGGATGGVVSRLVDELEAGTVPESELEALRTHLGVAGDGEAARLDAIADEMAAISRRQDELADRVDDLAARTARADAVEALEAAHEEDVSALRADLERREETVGEELAALRRDIEADLAALEREVEAFESTRRALIDGFRGTGDDDDDSAEDDDVPADDTDAPADDADDAATAGATDAADQEPPEERDEEDPDDVFIPPSRLGEVSGDADDDDTVDED